MVQGTVHQCQYASNQPDMQLTRSLCLFFLTILYFINFGSNGALIAQQSDFKGVYVWDFKTKEGRKNQLTEELTENYEVYLLKNRSQFNLLERRLISNLISHEENEGEITEDTKQKIDKNGANVVIFGELNRNSYRGEFSILVKFEELHSRRILFAAKAYIPEDQISDKTFLDSKFRELIPALSVLRFKQIRSTTTTKEKKILTQAEWRSRQKTYYEPFSDRMSSGFLGYIWNKRNHDDYDYYVDEEKNMYLFRIKKTNFIRHKYLQGDGIESSSDNIPYSVSAYIDGANKCADNKVCYGRGLTIAYNKGRRSCYAFIINDNGELKFVKIEDINDPSSISVLYTEQVQIEYGNKYDLGIVRADGAYALYFGGRFVTEIFNNDLQGDRFGVVSIGQGDHYIDNVTIYKN